MDGSHFHVGPAEEIVAERNYNTVDRTAPTGFAPWLQALNPKVINMADLQLM
jgi:hypothetical protein